jgi:hypothetical protein
VLGGAAPGRRRWARRRGRSSAAACVRETGEGENGIGFTGTGCRRVLFGRNARSAVDLDGRPAAAGLSRARFSPGGSGARAISVACGLAAGPRAHASVRRTAVGCILSRAEKESATQYVL